jgi:hypothetical protein
MSEMASRRFDSIPDTRRRFAATRRMSFGVPTQSIDLIGRAFWG